jgi:phosphoribosylamine-glycine ligase
MIDEQGQPRVIEFNCRFGDPETQPIMMRLKSSLVDLVEAGIAGKLLQKPNGMNVNQSVWYLLLKDILKLYVKAMLFLV